MSLRLAFAGFRHGHIFSLHSLADQLDTIEVVGASEGDEETRSNLAKEGKVTVTHNTLTDLLAEVACDAVAIGDVYVKRGALAIEALKAGKHVIADKPLCTSLEELEEIERLSRESGLKVGCMLDLRDTPPFVTLQALVAEGIIGQVHAVHMGGQHPLLRESRPGWYFEKGCHGGTLNDIAIHAVDALPWLTGSALATVNSARCWNAFAEDVPHFKDSAQMMLTLENGAGVIGDFSYAAPDSMGYSIPLYWRTTLFGRDGVLEVCSSATAVTAYLKAESEPTEIPLREGNPGGYLAAFLADIDGTSSQGQPTTATVLHSSRQALVIQRAGDENLHDQPL
ncbi:MAG: Gfo/Idh/MocA family protein [Planctomycetota bacterium]|jgi:predicted dehydrogenase